MGSIESNPWHNYHGHWFGTSEYLSTLAVTPLMGQNRTCGWHSLLIVPFGRPVDANGFSSSGCGSRDIDKVDDLMQDITEQQEVAQEISDAISKPVGFGEEFDEVRSVALGLDGDAAVPVFVL